MKIFAITQARISSTRLPEKVLKTINSRTLLEIHLSRILQSKLISKLIVATTTEIDASKIIAIADKLRVGFFKGSIDDVLERFYRSSWKAVGLEMEGGHYQRAISAAVIQGHISNRVRIRYAYYASDNPLRGGQTLAAGSMGAEGIVPTYLITKVLVQKILNPPVDRRCDL